VFFEKKEKRSQRGKLPKMARRGEEMYQMVTPSKNRLKQNISYLKECLDPYGSSHS
jgi:hypothetical protein